MTSFPARTVVAQERSRPADPREADGVVVAMRLLDASSRAVGLAGVIVQRCAPAEGKHTSLHPAAGTRRDDSSLLLFAITEGQSHLRACRAG